MRPHYALVLSVIAAGAAWADEGRELYAGRGDLPGRVAGVAGRGLACAGCHGPDAGGGGEGRARIPAIDRASLLGRTGAPYDRESFGRALTSGIAPDGRTLALGMPRFAATPEQTEALWRFLGSVRAEAETGITGDSVAFVVPTLAEDHAEAEAFRSALARAWDARGVDRVYGRAVRFEIFETADPKALDGFVAILPRPDPARNLVQDLVKSGMPVFAAGGGASNGRDLDAPTSGPCAAAEPDVIAALIDDALALCGRRLTRTAFQNATRVVCERRARADPNN